VSVSLALQPSPRRPWQPQPKRKHEETEDEEGSDAAFDALRNRVIDEAIRANPQEPEPIRRKPTPAPPEEEDQTPHWRKEAKKAEADAEARNRCVERYKKWKSNFDNYRFPPPPQ
jgi:hypothetical protein